jgi:bacterioferritin
MKGNAAILERLNLRLAEELTAINQYMVHSTMCEQWGYDRLHAVIEKRAIQEMKHAERLIERILFLEGQPVVSRLNAITIGASVAAQLRNDLEAELGAVKAYNDDVQFAAVQGDNGTRELLESILKDEEDHVDWIEAQLDQMKQMGEAQYLAVQVREQGA